MGKSVHARGESARNLVAEPETAPPELLGAEELVCYWWVAGLARGKRVLDAGCGLALGASALVEAGASLVVGVDSREPVLEAARVYARPELRLEHSELGRLPFEAGAFDLVVCFGGPEGAETPSAVLDELVRVLARDGVLAASLATGAATDDVQHASSNELGAALAERFPYVRLFHQSESLATGILDEGTSRPAGSPMERIEIRQAAPAEPALTHRTIALASFQSLPDPPQQVVLTGEHAWRDRLEAQERVIERQIAELAELRPLARERLELGLRLQEAERELAELRRLEQELAEVTRRAQETAQELQSSLVELPRLRHELTKATRRAQDLEGSLSWRMTRPFRAVHRVVLRRR